MAPGPAPVKSEAALRVVTPLLEAPVADRPNWTIPRLRAEIEAQAGVRISRSQLSRRCAKKVPLAAAAAHVKGRQDAAEVERIACACNCASSRPKPATSFCSTAMRARR